MDIFVKNAYSNNLKNISVSIPNNKITAITGVSGSGKSTLLKNIIGAYGAKNITKVSPKTIKDSLLISDDIDVEQIDNLSSTIFIDVKNSVNNPSSIVSTVSGIHEILRNLFSECGAAHCKKCGSSLEKDLGSFGSFFADLKVDDVLSDAINYLNENGKIIKMEYYDIQGNPTLDGKKKKLSTIEFTLNKISEKAIREFNNLFGARIYAIAEKSGEVYDVIRETECKECHTVWPRLSRSRLSFNTKYEDGGGACRCCGGTGMIVRIDEKNLFQKKSEGILSGASKIITEKGIKYTTVTEKFICAVYHALNIDINLPVDDIPEDKLNCILYGIDEEISFVDRIGGRKKLKYNGIANYLLESYKSGKGGSVLAGLISKEECPKCKGTRIDNQVSSFTFENKTIEDVLMFSLDELRDWGKGMRDKVTADARKYIDRLIRETDNFNKLSCGHLLLSRSSTTLSGGELQRIRVCALLNSNIKGICYLLDEPSSGLHYSDIEKLGELLRSICLLGNTVIMVEHNKKILQYCDHIVDMGPHGGRKGGTILFSDKIEQIGKYDTDTAKVILQSDELFYNDEEINEMNEFLEFKNLSYNNLKNISVRFPKNAFTTVCGVSGSGKSTFVHWAVYDVLEKNPKQYGFDGIKYFSQNSRTGNSLSNVSTILKISSYIAGKYEKKSRKKSSCFMPGSSEGKCTCCAGKGYIYSEMNEPIGVCEQCGGVGFDDKTLTTQIDGLNIYDMYHISMEELKGIITDKKLKEIIDAGCQLGIGYLTLSRNSKTLSKGELQRVSLIHALIGEEKNQLIILDEPSKGLHSADSGKLICALKKIVSNGNTLLAVEHNPDLIRHSDYMIEFGGTGVNGGYLLFQGRPNEVENTPTALMLKDHKTEARPQNGRISEDIIIRNSKKSIRYKPFRVYYELDNADILLETAKQSRDDFFAVAIPNNIMFSKKGDGMIQSDMPIVQTIDFNKKIDYKRSISETVGISELLKKVVSISDRTGIMKYVFNPESQTGKCITCGGTGKVPSIPIEYFVEKGEVSAACKKFLRNSTEFIPISKLLKKDNININQPLNMMSDEEQKILFWGYDKVYEIEGKPQYWKGIVYNFIKHHKYYPKKTLETIYNFKDMITCPICKGNMLKSKYTLCNCCGISYKDWMTSSINEIIESFDDLKQNTVESNKLIYSLKLLKNFNLGNYKISDELISLDAISAEKVKLIALFLNKVYKMGIIINNYGLLDKKDKEFVEELAETWADTNTIWIL